MNTGQWGMILKLSDEIIYYLLFWIIVKLKNYRGSPEVFRYNLDLHCRWTHYFSKHIMKSLTLTDSTVNLEVVSYSVRFTTTETRKSWFSAARARVKHLSKMTKSSREHRWQSRTRPAYHSESSERSGSPETSTEHSLIWHERSLAEMRSWQSCISSSWAGASPLVQPKIQFKKLHYFVNWEENMLISM